VVRNGGKQGDEPERRIGRVLESMSLGRRRVTLVVGIQDSLRMIVSSGAICEPYQTIGLVVGFASKTEGCGGKMAVEDTYKSALQRLIESAKSRKANALIYVSFQNRVASQAGCGILSATSWSPASRDFGSRAK